MTRPGGGNLNGCTVYLSGPMDFLALPREEERKHGWRARIGGFLEERGVTVLDPWHKPEIRDLHSYGKEDDKSTENRNRWTFDDTREESRRLRAQICLSYWPTVHLDLRMVDKSDFLIAFCPTNTYSVGTVHEIAVARQQHKPVLFVSPTIRLDSLKDLEEHLKQKGDEKGIELLQTLQSEQPMRPNLNGAPSLWYMGVLYGEYFFDSFGFDRIRQSSWAHTPLDDLEEQSKRERPLMNFLEELDRKIPGRFDADLKTTIPNDDWLIFKKRQEAGLSS